MITISQFSIRVARASALGALLRSALAACLLTGSAVAGAQPAAERRLWAAQTGVDQITLAWDSVPGAAQYRVYLGDPNAPGTLSQRPVSVLSGRTRRSILTGMQRAANGVTLVAVDAGGSVLKQAEFNRVTPATFYPPVTPPTGVTAQATSGSEIVVTWNPVPGATGYVIGRAVHRSGFRMLCSLCPAEVGGRYVDPNVMAGLSHTYIVAAIFPSGEISRRVASGPVTPGATQIVTAPVATHPGAPPGMPSGVPTGSSPTTLSGYPPPGQPAGTLPTTTTSSTGTSSATTSTSTHAATSPTGGTSGTTPIATPDPKELLGGATGRIADALAGGVAAPPSVTATASAPGTVVVNWQPSPTSGLTGYGVTRSLNGGAFEELARVAATERSYTDRFFPATLFASGSARARYGVVARASAGSRGARSDEVVVQPPAPAPSPGGGSVAACRLDFRRADNMWAAFGTPTGSPGAETISLMPGQNKVFITDWKYEKQRNDGTNFYGSHLRIGTNPTSSTIRLHLRSWTLTGLAVFARTGNDTFWIRLDPNATRQFQADLMEVFCES